MADLTKRESKLAEVLGLAMSAKTTTTKVVKLLGSDDHAAREIQKLHDHAAKLETMTTEVLSNDQFNGKKTAIIEQARATRHHADEMRDAYLTSDSEGLDGLEFLTMIVAGELGHWKILAKLNEHDPDRDLQELTDYVVPLQEGHFNTVLATSLDVAAHEDALALA